LEHSCHGWGSFTIPAPLVAPLPSFAASDVGGLHLPVQYWRASMTSVTYLYVRPSSPRTSTEPAPLGKASFDHSHGGLCLLWSVGRGTHRGAVVATRGARRL
jgi:hypothetical protein